MINIRKVAVIAGVSPSTVSRVLGASKGRSPVRPETSRRVKQVAKQLGYRLNYHMQAVSLGRANVTGFASEMVIDAVGEFGMGSMYFDALRRGVEFITQEAGSALLSVHPGRGLSAVERGAEYLRTRQLDALVVPASGNLNLYVKDLERDPTLPLVIVNAMIPIHRPAVVFDTAAAVQMIVEHLLALGHRRMLWLGPEATHPVDTLLRERLFIKTAWDAGLSGATCQVDARPLGTAAETDALLDLIAATLAGQLTAGPRGWTAIVAYNDQYAIAACRALRAAGLHVPRDVSVVGFDNLISTYCLPQLTTIDHGFFAMGQRAGRLAGRLADADNEGRQALLDYREIVAPKLIVRASTGPCSQSPA